MSRKSFLCVPLLVMLIGCATNTDAPRIDVAPRLRTATHSVRVIIGLDPDAGRMQNDAPRAAAASQPFGLLGAIVAAAATTAILSGRESTQQDRQRQLVEINKAAIDFNFGSELRAAIENGLKPISWLQPSSVRKEPTFQRDNADKLLAQQQDELLLIADGSFSFSDDFKQLSVTCYGALYSGKPEYASLGKRDVESGPSVLYRSKLLYSYPLEGEYKDGTTAVAAWSADNGAMVKRGLWAGVQHVARALAVELQTTPAVAGVGK